MAAASALARRMRALARRLRHGPRNGEHWVRIVMNREIESYLTGLAPSGLSAVEISGRGREPIGWKSFTSTEYPSFDLLQPADIGRFDVVICEQVLEHVRDPWRAMRSLFDLCAPGGHVVVGTPFMLRLHREPKDYWRFTPDGLREMAVAAGFESVAVGSWGNSWCTFANRRRWAVYRPVHRLLRRWSLRDEPDNPQVVWLFAQRPAA